MKSAHPKAVEHTEAEGAVRITDREQADGQARAVDREQADEQARAEGRERADGEMQVGQAVWHEQPDQALRIKHPMRPKRNYTISEISRLFGIGIDSLRYYERLGVISPQRGANGYRLYDLDDMYKLSLIKDLRRLDLPMKDIKSYLDQQTLASTQALLEQESALLRERIAQLQDDLQSVQDHARELTRALKRPVGVIETVEREPRHCVELSARIERDEEMDLLIQRLHRQYEHILPHLGMLEIGGALSVEDLDAGRANVYNSVFFVLEEPETGAGAPCDFVLDEGTYLALRYRGPYEQNAAVYAELKGYAAAHGFILASAPYEFYEIDNRDTADPSEFLSRVEVRIA